MNSLKMTQQEEGLVIMHPAAKEILNIKEAVAYLGISKSQMYKLTSARIIPFSRPSGKLIFFKLEDVINWALSNHIVSLNGGQNGTRRI